MGLVSLDGHSIRLAGECNAPAILLRSLHIARYKLHQDIQTAYTLLIAATTGLACRLA
jgi:hypothetical protein